jgi:hypothetical protein
LRGIGVTTLAAGVADTVYGRAQDAHVAVRLVLTRKQGGLEHHHIHTDLDYDPHLLYPIGWSDAGTLTVGHALVL